jgi:hypothetical protein
VQCEEEFNYIRDFCRHLKHCLTSRDPIKCPECKKRLTSIKVLKYHLLLNECLSQQGKGQKISLPNNTLFIESESAFNKFFQVFSLYPSDLYNNSDEFFNKYKNDESYLITF